MRDGVPEVMGPLIWGDGMRAVNFIINHQVSSCRPLFSQTARWQVPFHYILSGCQCSCAGARRVTQRVCIDFEDPWPALPGDEEPACLGIICKAIQDGFGPHCRRAT